MNRLHQLDASFRQWLRRIAADDPDPMTLHHGGYCNAIGGTTTGRYVVLKINMGLDNKRLLNELDEATVGYIIPWDVGNQRPQVYLDRKRVALEVPLPRGDQDRDVTLHSLTSTGHGGRVIILGPNEMGRTVSLALNNLIHLLIGGETGSGKTYTMRSIAYQLANGINQIVLIDGKRGDGLGILDGLPGQIGPLAYTKRDVHKALSWVCQEMLDRYKVVVEERGGRVWGRDEGPPHLIVFFDEFQAYSEDEIVGRLFHDLATMGRSARIHLIAGTQKPLVSSFGAGGSTTRDQFGLRIAHKVSTYTASEAIIGSNAPRADNLLGQGDAYVVGTVGGDLLRERVQIAYVPEAELATIAKHEPQLSEWSSASYAATNNGRGRPRMQFNNRQLAVSIRGAQQGWGRPALQEFLEELGEGIAGSEPADRLLEKGRRIQDELEELR